MKKRNEKRMKSYVTRGNELMQKGKNEEAYKMIEDGLGYYSENVVRAISPYAMADAGLIVTVLRHIANEVEEKNAGAKELAEYLDKKVHKPVFTERTEIKKPNMR